MFVGKMTDWVKKELAKSKNEFAYAIDTILFLTTVREKYVQMYERFIMEFKSYSKAIRIFSQGYLLISLIPPSRTVHWFEGRRLNVFFSSIIFCKIKTIFRAPKTLSMTF